MYLTEPFPWHICFIYPGPGSHCSLLSWLPWPGCREGRWRGWLFWVQLWWGVHARLGRRWFLLGCFGFLLGCFGFGSFYVWAYWGLRSRSNRGNSVVVARRCQSRGRPFHERSCGWAGWHLCRPHHADRDRGWWGEGCGRREGWQPQHIQPSWDRRDIEEDPQAAQDASLRWVRTHRQD